jgi:hypothetical protein
MGAILQRFTIMFNFFEKKNLLFFFKQRAKNIYVYIEEETFIF